MGDISKDIQSSFPSEKIKALINIKYTASWLNKNEVSFFKPYGISPQQFNILRILRGAKEAIKVQLVKERMIEQSPNATRLMDKLLDKALIERYRCEHDRRVVYVNISEKGKLLLLEIDKAEKPGFLKTITDAEAKVLNEILDKIR
ncbi:MAG: MarR family winged helix-turn-helix transcriptional regulator [Flavobacteriaceae bacterium]